MDPGWGEAVLSVGVGLGLAAAAGLRVFLPLLMLGAAARLGWVPLVEGFDWLSSTSGLTALGVATILEVGAYYVPWIDNLLDTVAAPLAVLTGVLATAAVTTDLPPPLRWALAVVAGGGTAGAVQAVTSLARLKSSALTAGLGNPLLATLELAGSFLTSLVAIVLPVVAIGLVIAFFLLIRRVARGMFGRRVPQAP
ncbi:MAG TPA: DUF4126 domain-containing protein [Vicinamibacterales bacterium]|nr:DUF4126 domain-containing protein [Vicinamibacterales bacterium]